MLEGSDDGKRAYSAIEVASQAATPYGRGSGGNHCSRPRMTESALTARLKLHGRAPAPMEGGLGETKRPGFGFTGAWSLKLRLFSLFFVSFFVSFVG